MRTGAFVAVPLFRVNEYPIGPHPAGSYESEPHSPSPPFTGLYTANTL